MRILRVAQKLYPEVKGGGPYHVHAMSRDQAAMGHDVTVLTVRYDPSSPHLEQRDGYTVVRYDPTASALGNELSTGVAQFLANTGGFDVIHAHSHLYASTNLAALRRRLTSTPLAITNHGLYSQTAPKRLFDVYLRTLGRWTFNSADVVFTYTNTERKQLSEFGVDSDVVVVPNGIDTGRFTSNGPRNERIDADGFVILFVGRLVEGKRPLDAVRALDAVRRRGIDATLYVAGEGPLESELHATARERGLSESIRLIGHVPYDEMPGVYRTADALVLPSRDEGMPRTVLEALASGVSVVVSSELKQVRLAFGDDVACADDTDSLGTCLSEALENDTRPMLDESFDWGRTVVETTSRLEQLVELRAPTGQQA